MYKKSVLRCLEENRPHLVNIFLVCRVTFLHIENYLKDYGVIYVVDSNIDTT